jgi:exosortase C (VPDSG-CTERM-specific)
MKEMSAHSAAPPSASTRHLPGHVLAFLLFAAGLIAVFAGPLISLVILAAESDLHSHILLIPFVSAYVLYLRRSTLPADYTYSPGWATIPLIVGAMGLVAAWVPGVFGTTLSHHDHVALMTLSFVCFLAAGGFLFLGQKWMTAATFPFAFLIFLVPLPDRMVDFLETASKLGSTEAANFFFSITGTPVLRDGTVFQLPGITIRVAQECSGIRSSWVLLITSVLAANLFLRSPWHRIALVLFTIPLGIVRNGFRVWTIGTLCIQIGPKMIHSVIHRQGGPLFFTLALGPLFLLLWWLRRSEWRGIGRSSGELECAPALDSVPSESGDRPGPQQRFDPPVREQLPPGR